MSDKTLLKEIEKMIVANNEVLLDAVDEKIGEAMVTNNVILLEAVDERIMRSEQRTASTIKASQEETFKEIKASQEETFKEIKASQEETFKEIKASQEDTIEALTEAINTGYSMHEERIERIEVKVGLPPIKQKH